MVNENDLGEILAQDLERIKECGERINFAEIERRTGISRAVLRRWQSNGYVIQPSRKGWRSGTSKLDDVSETVDALLQKGVANSSVIFERILEFGYDGGISILTDYIRRHRDLVPTPRHIVRPRGTGGADTPPSAGTAIRWTGASSTWSMSPAMGGGAHVSSWSATTVDSGMWSSSPTLGRRTCS